MSTVYTWQEFLGPEVFEIWGFPIWEYLCIYNELFGDVTWF